MRKFLALPLPRLVFPRRPVTTRGRSLREANLYGTVIGGHCFFLLGAFPATSDVERTRSLVEARISGQPELADSFDWLQEAYRLSVKGYAGQNFVRIADEFFQPFTKDGVITANEFSLAQERAAEASYDESIRSILNHLTRGSTDQIELPFSLRKAAGQQAGRIKSKRLAQILELDLDGNWEVSRSEIDAKSVAVWVSRRTRSFPMISMATAPLPFRK